MDLNIVTFIFFALAVVVFIQLRNVLGRRTGHERPPFDPYAKAAAAGLGDAAKPAAAKAAEANPFAAIDAYAPAGSPLNKDLRAIARASGGFSPQEFLAGAGKAYEMILTAFAKGARDDLRRLLADNVYADFAEALDKRAAAGERVEFSFIGVDKAEIAAASLVSGEAQIIVSLRGEILSASYDKDGGLIEGDAQNIVTLRDKWTFARMTASKSPDWLLAATEDEEE